MKKNPLKKRKKKSEPTQPGPARPQPTFQRLRHPVCQNQGIFQQLVDCLLQFSLVRCGSLKCLSGFTMLKLDFSKFSKCSKWHEPDFDYSDPKDDISAKKPSADAKARLHFSIPDIPQTRLNYIAESCYCHLDKEMSVSVS